MSRKKLLRIFFFSYGCFWRPTYELEHGYFTPFILENFYTKTEKLGKKIYGLSKMKISFLHDKIEGEKDYTRDQEAF